MCVSGLSVFEGFWVWGIGLGCRSLGIELVGEVVKMLGVSLVDPHDAELSFKGRKRGCKRLP